MKYHQDKIFILAITLIVIVYIFSYKTYSVNLQKEVINSQLLKENKVIQEKEKVDENKRQEEQAEGERQRELLNSCLQISLDYEKKAYELIRVQSNECIEKFPSRESQCWDNYNNSRSEIKNNVEKSEDNCYKKYPQK